MVDHLVFSVPAETLYLVVIIAFYTNYTVQ